MSDRLVVEFYSETSVAPIAVVLAFHAGDNPAVGSLNVAAFLLDMKRQTPNSVNDAGCLATQYVLWQSRANSDVSSDEVVLIDPNEEHPYQVIRIKVKDRAVSLTIVADRFSSESELEEAAEILRQAGLSFQIQALAVNKR